MCVFGGGGLLGVRVVTEREFTVYGGNFWEGSKRSVAKRSEAERSEAERSEAKRSVAKRSVAKRSGA